MTFDAAALNAALAMSLEWGPVRSRPLEDRIAERFPHLTSKEVMALKLTAAEVERLGFAEYERVYLNQSSGIEAKASIRCKFPWIDDDNLSHIATQGQYYAWRENG